MTSDLDKFNDGVLQTEGHFAGMVTVELEGGGTIGMSPDMIAALKKYEAAKKSGAELYETREKLSADEAKMMNGRRLHVGQRVLVKQYMRSGMVEKITDGVFGRPYYRIEMETSGQEPDEIRDVAFCYARQLIFDENQLVEE